MKTWISVVLLVFVCFFQKGDAAITGWTVPSGGDASASIAESAVATDNVATILATTGDTISAYNLLTTTTLFTLDSTSGELTVTASNTLDYETNPTYVLSIEAVDSLSASGTATLTVSVTNVATDPTFSATTYNLCVLDGTVASTSVYALTASDPNGDSLTYSIGGGNTNTDFTIASGTGVISTANALVRATTGTYDLIIHAADATLSATATISVSVETDCSSATALVVSSLAILTSLVVALH